MIPSRTRKLRWSGLALAACLGAAGYGILGSAPSEVAPERSGTTEALMASALRAATHDDCGTDCSHGKPPVNRALFEKYYKFFQPNKDRMVWVNKELGNPEAGQIQVPVAKVVACFAPGTPEEVQAAFLQAMADAGHWPGESGIEYFVGTRWSGTQGTPRALTWSFVPDGTNIPSAFGGDPAGPSTLFATLDTQFSLQGGRARWITIFESVFARWAQLTGTSYTRVQNGASPADSGGAFPGTAGSATTGDVRISLRNIDGAGGILAYNYFPSTGDMVLDASESWNTPTNDHRFFRNTLSHEHGHGLAVEHVCSNNSAQLMEPFLNTAFDGPQHDDIRAVQWLYGDAAEPNGTSATASALGSIATPQTRSFGDTPADPTFNTMPIPTNGSLFSLNLVGAANDIDFHSLTLTGAGSNVTVTAIPVGLTYDNNPQNPTTGACPSGASVNSLALVRLNVELRASNGTTVLGSSTASAAGNNAAFTVNGLAAGNYFVRVTSPDTLSQTQLYRLQVVTTASVNNPPVLVAIGNRTVNELNTLTFTAIATDPDAGQTRTFSLVGAPAGASINATTGAFSWTPTEAQGPGSYTFTVRVTDNGVPAASDEEAITVTVNEVNVAPVLAAIGNRTVNEGTALTFTASATDADVPANTLTYSLVGAPTGASINATTGVFSWTPTEAQGPGTFTFTVVVADNGSPSRDDTESITVTVNEVNQAPVLGAIGNRTVNEGTALTFNATATDADAPANTLTYSLVGAPAGASINATTGAFSWTPTEAQGPGTFTFTVRVADNGTPSLNDTESITVTVNEVNVAPVLATIGNRTVDEGTALTFTATATDADAPANTLTYSLVGAPAGATINATTGAFSWTPTEAQGPGTFTFTVRVADNGTPSLNDTESITVTVNEVNVAPVLGAIGNQTVNEGTALNFTATATDADAPANTLTYSLVGAPAGAGINPTTGAFSWTPTEAQGPGTFTFTVRVADNGTPSLNDTETITVTVNEANRPPVLAAIGNRTVNEGATLSFTASATDPDLPANTLTYSLLGAPAGASINPTTGVFSWTPTEAQGPGTFNFLVAVADNGSPSLGDSEFITVTVNEVNQAPTLASIAPITVNEGQTASFTAVGTDADLPAQTLTYSLVGAPAGASINPSTGVFSWTPSPVQFLQTFTFTVTVTDNGAGNLSASRSVTITTAYTNKVISGNVILESLSIPSNTFTVSLEFTPVGGGTVVTLANIPLGPTGDYSVSTSAIPAGNYDIRAKAIHWLAKKNVGVAISASGATGQNFSLKNGDVNGDNEVGAADFSLMAAAYDSVVGDPNYNPDADLNGDGEVGAADFSILAASYDEVGD